MGRLEECYSTADLRLAARRRAEGRLRVRRPGVEDKIALANRRRAFEPIKLRSRIMVDLDSDVIIL